MADLVARWFQKIITLSDEDRRRLLDMLTAYRRLPPVPSPERQRRYRLRKGLGIVTERNGHGVTGDVTERNADTVTERNASDVTARNGVAVTARNGTPPTPPVSKSLTSFDVFWKLYPKHIGKGAAVKAWKQGNCEEKAEFICSAVSAQMAYFQSQGPKYTPNPATWLNQKRWDDEPPMPSLLSEKTRGNVASLAAFVEGVEARDRIVP